MYRLLNLIIFAEILLCLFLWLGCSGCTYNRNAPLINVQDSANGNTVIP